MLRSCRLLQRDGHCMLHPAQASGCHAGSTAVGRREHFIFPHNILHVSRSTNFAEQACEVTKPTKLPAVHRKLHVHADVKEKLRGNAEQILFVAGWKQGQQDLAEKNALEIRW